MSKEIMEYIVYIIHACSKKWCKPPVEVYKLLSSDGCIDGYLIPNYDILHTQSTQFMVEDVEEYITKRGGKI